MAKQSVLELVLIRDRIVVIASLIVVIVLAWGYTLSGAGTGMSALDMTVMSTGDSRSGTSGASGTMRMTHAAVMQPAVWTLWYAIIMFLMWWIMMVAMMLPSASPMVLLFSQVERRAADNALPLVSVGVFVAGYLVLWAGFSLVATGLQWGLQQAGLLSSMMTSTSSLLGGTIRKHSGNHVRKGVSGTSRL